jgi:hypothetical protein
MRGDGPSPDAVLALAQAAGLALPEQDVPGVVAALAAVAEAGRDLDALAPGGDVLTGAAPEQLTSFDPRWT